MSSLAIYAYQQKHLIVLHLWKLFINTPLVDVGVEKNALEEAEEQKKMVGEINS